MACDDDPELIEPMDPIIPVACFEVQKDSYKYTFNADCSQNAVDYEWDFDANYSYENESSNRSFEKIPPIPMKGHLLVTLHILFNCACFQKAVILTSK